MPITQINNRYMVETPDGRAHVLNKKSLIWNLKNVFKVSSEDCKEIIRLLELDGKAELNLQTSIFLRKEFSA